MKAAATRPIALLGGEPRILHNLLRFQVEFGSHSWETSPKCLMQDTRVLGRAFILVDPHNDILSGGGKLWPMVEGVAKEVRLLDNLKGISAAVQGWRPGLYRVASSLGARRLRTL